MNKAHLLAEQRIARDRARAEFKRRLGLAKEDLAPPVLKRRAIDELQQASLSVARQAIDIASDNRGIVAATVATLFVWLTRKPIWKGANKLSERFKSHESSPTEKLKALAVDYWHRLKEYADE
jgi:hypothetical protein